MIDLNAAQQLLTTYAYAIDAREFELLDDVFTADSSVVVSIADGDTYPFEGRDTIVSFIRDTTLAQTDRRHHVITNVRMAGPSTSTAILTLFVVDNGAIEAKTAGVYTCEYAEENGAARIKSMHLALDWAF